MNENIVIGANGLVGSHVILHLLKSGKRATAISRNGQPFSLFYTLMDWYGLSSQECDNLITWKKADVTDVYSFEDIISKNAIVYHCAALVSFHDDDKVEMDRINILGTANVVNVCNEKQVRKLAYISSVSTLSMKENTNVLDEESYWKTNGKETNYARSKYLAEMEVWRGIEEGLNAVMVNPTIIIGPHDFSKGSVQLINTIFEGLKFYPSGSTGFVDANDVAKAIIELAESNLNAQRYILNGANLSYHDFFVMVCRSFNISLPKWEVNSWMSGIAWRLDKLRAFIFRIRPLITKETANASSQKRMYNSSKIIETLSFSFIPASEFINNTCSFYLKLKSK
jgi:nucleoside-diphosphate-sugar epimerase